MMPRKIFTVSTDKGRRWSASTSRFSEADVFHTLAERMEEFRKIETGNKLFHKIFLNPVGGKKL
jgi:hypothetical protein